MIAGHQKEHMQQYTHDKNHTEIEAATLTL
jgi:hypothetical protein